MIDLVGVSGLLHSPWTATVVTMRPALRKCGRRKVDWPRK